MTSKTAAQPKGKPQPQPEKQALRARVLELVQKAGPTGYTCEELENRLKLSHQTVSPRVTDLLKQGLIAYGENKRKTRTGRPARVYTATPEKIVLPLSVRAAQMGIRSPLTVEPVPPTQDSTDEEE